MTANAAEPSVVRFGSFELALETGELRRDGVLVHLAPQPAKVLALLATRPGRLVTREEIRGEVWDDDTFVDFEHGVNFCIREIRAALGDSARAPRYVETLPRRGYRFVAEVESEPRLPPVAEPVAAVKVVPRSERAARSYPVVVAVAVALLLAAAVYGWTSLGRTSREAKDSEARQEYLAGRYLWNKGTAGEVGRSLEYFERAVALDPGYAPAYAGLADSYRLLAMLGTLPTRDAMEKATSAAIKALELDPGLVEARVSLGSILFRYDWDWAGAERELRRATSDAPRYGLGHHDYAWFLVAVGRFDEAIAAIERARDLDPLSPLANADVGWVYLRARRYDEAITQIERTFELEPDFPPAFSCLELAYVYKGMYAEAKAVALRHLERSGAGEDVLKAVEAAEPAEALRRAWRWRLERRIEAGRRLPYPYAALHAALGEREEAFEWLERAYAERDPMLVSLNVDPAFDGLRSDARFADLLRRLGLGA